MIHHLVLARERSASFNPASIASIDRAPKACVAHVVNGSVVPAQLVSSTEGCAAAGRDVADVSTRALQSARGRSDVRIVLGIGSRGIGREVWRVSVDDKVTGLVEVARLELSEGRFKRFEV